MWLKTERGVHAETLLVARWRAGEALAAQTAAFVRGARSATSRCCRPGGSCEDVTRGPRASICGPGGLLVVATTKSGERFSLGDLINGYLVQQSTSDFHALGIRRGRGDCGGRQARGIAGLMSRCSSTPSATRPARRNSASCRSPLDHQPHLAARQALDQFWLRARAHPGAAPMDRGRRRVARSGPSIGRW